MVAMRRPARSRTSSIIDTAWTMLKTGMEDVVGARPRNAPAQIQTGTSTRHLADKKPNRRQRRGATALQDSQLYDISRACPGMNVVKVALKQTIGSTGWGVRVDLDDQYDELDRLAQWFEMRSTSDVKLRPVQRQHLDPVIWDEIHDQLSGVERLDARQSYRRISMVMGAVRAELEATARAHAHEVDGLLRHPNDDMEPDFDTLLKLVLEDLIVIDQGMIGLTRNIIGTRVVEMFYIPGDEVWRWAYDDRTLPDPPIPCYTWEKAGHTPAHFTKNDAIYLQRHPQRNGYGMSPVEMAVAVLNASLLSHEYELEMLSQQGLPPVVVELGNVDDSKRDRFAKEWESTLNQAGRGKAIFTNMATAVENQQGMVFHHFDQLTPADLGTIEFFDHTLRIMSGCCGMSAQDVGWVQDFHRTTAEVQKQISQGRGIGSWMCDIEEGFNEGLVKVHFPFTDVRFYFDASDTEEERAERQEARSDMAAGLLSINEVREDQGKAPIAGGDVHYKETAMGLVPVEMAATNVAAQAEGQATAPPGQAPQLPQQQPVVGSEQMTQGMSPDEEGMIQPTIGNPWLEMSPLADMRKLQELPDSVRHEINTHGRGVMAALDEDRVDDAKKLVSRLIYRLGRDADMAGATAPELQAADMVGAYSGFLDELEREMLDIVDEIASGKEKN